MAKAGKLKTCAKGHKFQKSSDCPTCPACEALRKPKDGLLAQLVAPARRALESKGIDSIEKLAKWTESDILALHGLGPSSLPKLKDALRSKGLAFKSSRA